MADLYIYGVSIDDTLENLEKVLARCEENGLVLNWEKSHLMVRDGIFWGIKYQRKALTWIELKLKLFEIFQNHRLSRA
ncbi:UNVERIFIED_CONTAM: hypothetical protein ITH36_25005 [Salmonella enterica subsp. enterica serovar Weltevreden]